MSARIVRSVDDFAVYRKTRTKLQLRSKLFPLYCTTRCVNGGTYAIRNTRMPTRHASAMLWKKT